MLWATTPLSTGRSTPLYWRHPYLPPTLPSCAFGMCPRTASACQNPLFNPLFIGVFVNAGLTDVAEQRGPAPVDRFDDDHHRVFRRVRLLGVGEILQPEPHAFAIGVHNIVPVVIGNDIEAPRGVLRRAKNTSVKTRAIYPRGRDSDSRRCGANTLPLQAPSSMRLPDTRARARLAETRVRECHR